MSIYLLVIWTVVSYGPRHDWRPMGEFVGLKACQEAAAAMAVQDRYRCIPTGRTTGERQ